jgi:hypothetical protein
VLLYDFGCKTGDTINLPYYHPINFDFEIYCDTTYPYIVTVLSHNVNSGYYNFPDDSIISVGLQPIDDSYCNDMMKGYYSFYGAFFAFYNELDFCINCTGIDAYNDVDSIYDCNTKCFWYKGKWVGGFCQLYYDIEEINNNEIALMVTPNPVNESAVIKIPSGKYQHIEIYDILGTKV